MFCQTFIKRVFTVQDNIKDLANGSSILENLPRVTKAQKNVFFLTFKVISCKVEIGYHGLNPNFCYFLLRYFYLTKRRKTEGTSVVF
jgi:hypothetical protein